MIAFDRQSGAFVITDLGRIAAKYYIRHASIEIFNKEFRPGMTEADALVILCQSTEVCSSVFAVGNTSHKHHSLIKSKSATPN